MQIFATSVLFTVLLVIFVLYNIIKILKHRVGLLYPR
jgi:hypothetical protein